MLPANANSQPCEDHCALKPGANEKSATVLHPLEEDIESGKEKVQAERGEEEYNPGVDSCSLTTPANTNKSVGGK